MIFWNMVRSCSRFSLLSSFPCNSTAANTNSWKSLGSNSRVKSWNLSACYVKLGINSFDGWWWEIEQKSQSLHVQPKKPGILSSKLDHCHLHPKSQSRSSNFETKSFWILRLWQQLKYKPKDKTVINRVSPRQILLRLIHPDRTNQKYCIFDLSSNQLHGSWGTRIVYHQVIQCHL